MEDGLGIGLAMVSFIWSISILARQSIRPFHRVALKVKSFDPINLSPPTMSSLEPKSTVIIDGTAIAKYVLECSLTLSDRCDMCCISVRVIRDGIAQNIAAKRAQFPRFQPHLVILQAGARPDSSVYVRMKAKAATEAGIKFTHVQLDANATVDQVIDEVTKLNGDESVSGVLVQLPLGDHVGPEDERRVTEAVSPQKDVDG